MVQGSNYAGAPTNVSGRNSQQPSGGSDERKPCFALDCKDWASRQCAGADCRLAPASDSFGFPCKAAGETQSPHAPRHRAWASPDPPEGQPPRLPVPMTAAPEAGWAARLGDSLRAPGPGVRGAPTKAWSSRPLPPRAGGVARTLTSHLSAPDWVRGNQLWAVGSRQGTAGGSLGG